MSNDEKTYWTINRDFFGRSGPRWTKKTFQIVLNATNGDGVNATTKLPLQVENEMLKNQKNQVVCFLSLSIYVFLEISKAFLGETFNAIPPIFRTPTTDPSSGICLTISLRFSQVNDPPVGGLCSFEPKTVGQGEPVYVYCREWKDPDRAVEESSGIKHYEITGMHTGKRGIFFGGWGIFSLCMGGTFSRWCMGVY